MTSTDPSLSSHPSPPPEQRYGEHDPHNFFALVPAAYVFFLRHNSPEAQPELLLQLRQNTGFMDGLWAAGAAGHVDPGESVLRAALREAHEELGVSLAASQLEPLTTLHRIQADDGSPREQRVDFFFACRQWSGEPCVSEPERAAALQWWPLDDLPPMPPHERMVADHLAAYLRGTPLPSIMLAGYAASPTHNEFPQ